MQFATWFAIFVSYDNASLAKIPMYDAQRQLRTSKGTEKWLKRNRDKYLGNYSNEYRKKMRFEKEGA